MKVVYVDMSTQVGGGEIYLRKLVEAERPFEAIVLTRHAVFAGHAVELVWRNWRQIWSTVQDADVIHLNSIRFLWLFAWLPRRIRLLVTQHSSLQRTSSGFRYGLKKGLLALLASRIDCYICVAEYFRGELPRRLLDRTVVIPNGVADIGLPIAMSSVSRPFAVAFLGRLEVAKGILDVCRLAERVLATEARVVFHVAGDGSQRGAVAEMACRFPGRFHYHGFIDDSARLLGEADLLCLPSCSEGAPLAIIEAFMHEVPVLAYRVPGVEEMVRDYENGLLCARETGVDGLLAALQSLIENRALQEKLARQARATYEARYRIEAMRDSTYQLYTAL